MTGNIRLWVDDIRPAPEGWTLARTVTEAIRILDENVVEEISLDYDISLSVKVGLIHRPYPCGETFEPVARFIRMMARRGILLHTMNYGNAGPYKQKIKVAIHTASDEGRKNLLAILDDVKRHVYIVENPMPPCNRFEGEPK